MNKICGIFNLGHNGLNKIIEQKEINPTYLSEHFLVVADRISDTERNYQKHICDAKIGVVITFIGELKNFRELCESYGLKVKSDVELLLELYRTRKDRFIEELNGLFTLVIYDSKAHELLICQDIFSSPLNLYYCVSNDNFFFSTSLKQLLLWSSIERELNDESIFNFLSKKCIPSEQTLIKNVYKLLPGQRLRISRKHNAPKIEFIPYRSEKKWDRKYCVRNYYNIVERCVQRTIDSLNHVNIALSSGYDSNFLLYTIRNLTDQQIKAFTIGGREGRDERKNVILASKVYQNIKHIQQVVDEKTFKNIPEIVWRQEDLVHLPSNFVKLQLANLAEQEGCKTLICGDCCDEILGVGWTDKVPIKIKVRDFARSFSFVRKIYCFIKKGQVHFSQFDCAYNTFKPKTRGFELGYFRILKHAGIMMNSFSIEPRFPYLDKEFVDCASKLQSLNKKSKRWHHKFIRNILPAAAIGAIQHLGGSIDESFMFKAYMNAICHKFKESDIAKKYIGSNLVEEIHSEPMRYMDLILETLYLDIFQDIFISGDYDRTFKESKFDTELEQFLNK